MGYVYNVYGPDQVEAARKNYAAAANSTPTYYESAATQQARQAADSYASAYRDTVNKGYRSNYTGQINKLANNYTNADFNWSKEGSREYQSLSDYYRNEGKRQQENVQGAYAANTGGYSNSYAQAAGQREYGKYIDELAAKVPSLRQSALADWNAQQERTLNQISLLKGMDDTAYSRYRDKVADTYNFMTYYENKYGTERGLDMSAFQNELTKWQTRTNAAQNDLSTIRQLAESQYEHNTLSADTQASIEASRAQNDAYYRYLYSQLK